MNFTVTVLSDCVNTTITDKSISNMTIQIAQAANTQDVTFSDSIATSHSNLAYCGARTYTLSPTKLFLTISGTTMTLSTSSPSDVGTYSFTLTIGLIDFPAIPTISKTFTLDITCTV